MSARHTSPARRRPGALLALLVALAALGWALLAGAAQAQATPPAALVADAIRVSPDRTLVAEGNVEIFHQGRRLRARRIVYSASGDVLRIEGPLILTEGTDTILLADEAALAGDLRDGILRGARLVLNQQLQMASTEIARIGGRYTRLGPSVASSCRICAQSETPLWEIRAASVIHDDEAQRIYFDRAEFRLRGVPIFYLPRLDMPDPRVTRATGFLAPEIRGSRTLGPGIRIPYFIAIAPDRDLLLTPYVTARSTFALDTRYRQAFGAGMVELRIGAARDRVRPGRTRGWMIADAEFDLGRGVEFSARIEAVGDAAVRSDYDLPLDRVLESRLALSRVSRDQFARARLTQFRSLRDTDTNAQLPNTVFDARFERHLPTPALGGRAALSFDLLAAARRESTDILGRDVARASARLDWLNEGTLAGGLRGAVQLQLQADTWGIRQDSTFDRRVTRLTPGAAMTLRLPMARTERGGAVQMLEPVAQIAWSRPRSPGAPAVPNEDSRLLELDEANLWALDRFLSFDVQETGARANLGVNWTRIAPEGWSSTITLGRVVRSEVPPPGTFSALSGLDGRRSAWLAAARLDTGDGLSLAGRALFDSSLDLGKAEVMLGWRGERLDLRTGYAHLSADPAENRPARGSEWSVDAELALSQGWTALADWRYDLVAGRATSAGLGARFRNECLAVDVSVSRRHPTSTSVAPVVDFGIRVDLIGFGGGTAPGPARRCSY